MLLKYYTVISLTPASGHETNLKLSCTGMNPLLGASQIKLVEE